jgi:hypothetical protein
MSTDTKYDDLVTEEMVTYAMEAYDGARISNEEPAWARPMQAALRAVAPMLAARADPYKRQEREHIKRAVAAEREACAHLVETMLDRIIAGQIAAAIRARGETP